MIYSPARVRLIPGPGESGQEARTEPRSRSTPWGIAGVRGKRDIGNGAEATPPDTPMRVVRIPSIHAVSEAVWDSLNARIDLYHTHRFLRSLEDASGEEVCFWYLLFYEGERLSGSAALSSFDVRLDLFLGKHGRGVIDALRKFFPSLLVVRILFCGLPISIGKSSLALAPGADGRAVLQRLAAEMTGIAREERIGFLCVKEFLEGEKPQLNELRRQGFFEAPSLPYASLRLVWGSFDEYLDAMRYGYRRLVLQSLRKVNLSPSREKGCQAAPGDACLARIVVGGPEICPAPTFHRLYLEVMRRAEFTLETLPVSFFERLFENLAPDLRLFTVVHENTILGAALCVVEHGRMTFLLVGLDYETRNRYDVYFNLLHSITRSAIDERCSVLDLGQTSYWVKSRIGAETTREWFYLRSQNIAVHGILKVLRPVLFPHVPVPTMSVMKKSQNPPTVPQQKWEA